MQHPDNAARVVVDGSAHIDYRYVTDDVIYFAVIGKITYRAANVVRALISSAVRYAYLEYGRARHDTRNIGSVEHSRDDARVKTVDAVYEHRVVLRYLRAEILSGNAVSESDKSARVDGCAVNAYIT